MKDVHISRKGRRIIIKAGKKKEAKMILEYLPDKMRDIMETCEGYRQIGFQCDNGGGDEDETR
jgi:hypothetical protein